MFTSIIILGLLAIKDEIVGIVELFSTLQGNTIAYRIITFISIATGMFEIRFISVYSGTWQEYIVLILIVAIIGAEAGAQILKFKTRIKNWLRKKLISKSQKRRWEEIKNETQIQRQNQQQNQQIQQDVKEKSNDLCTTITRYNDRGSSI